MGCGCAAVVIAIALGIVFFIYASTDPGPPIDGFVLLLALVTMIVDRTLGVPSRLRTGPE
jgi:hypothetical protein